MALAMQYTGLNVHDRCIPSTQLGGWKDLPDGSGYAVHRSKCT